MWSAEEAERIGRQIGRIESLLETSLQRLDDHETRIRRGERVRNALAGAWAVVTLIGGLLFRSLWRD